MSRFVWAKDEVDFDQDGDELRDLAFDPDQPRDETGRWTDSGGAAASDSASVEPRIFRTRDDVDEFTSMGGGRRFTWKDSPGELLMGEPLDKSALPDTLYHVTTNAPAVESSGLLLGQNKDAGLGGGQADGVSFTSSESDAALIQRELVRSVEIARGDVAIDDLARLAREDESVGGLAPGALDDAVSAARQMWDVNIQSTEVYASPESKRSLMRDAYNSYLFGRERIAGDGVPSLKNPILFGNQKQLRLIDPANIRTLRVPSTNIPDRALITTGSDEFLHEVRVYSDVPVRGMTRNVAHAAAWVPRVAEWDESLHPRDESGKFSGSGSTGGSPSDPFAGNRIFAVKERAEVVAQALAVSPDIINVVDKAPSKFRVGDTTFTEAGHFSPSTGMIELNAQLIALHDTDTIDAMVAHEVSHAVFKGSLDRLEREHEEIRDMPKEEYDHFFQLNGYLREERMDEYAERFPTSALFAQTWGDSYVESMRNHEAMEREDGFTEYSRAYWKPDLLDDSYGLERALNETLAEITRLIAAPRATYGVVKPIPPDSPWMKLAKGLMDLHRRAAVHRSKLI
jgi:hypothetical protein